MSESYITKYWNEGLTQFILDYINKHSFINIRSVRKNYSPSIRYKPNMKMAISIKIGKIIKELHELGIISNWNTKSYKINYKGLVFEKLEMIT